MSMRTGKPGSGPGDDGGACRREMDSVGGCWPTKLKLRAAGVGWTVRWFDDLGEVGRLFGGDSGVPWFLNRINLEACRNPRYLRSSFPKLSFGVVVVRCGRRVRCRDASTGNIHNWLVWAFRFRGCPPAAQAPWRPRSSGMKEDSIPNTSNPKGPVDLSYTKCLLYGKLQRSRSSHHRLLCLAASHPQSPKCAVPQKYVAFPHPNTPHVVSLFLNFRDTVMSIASIRY